MKKINRLYLKLDIHADTDRRIKRRRKDGWTDGQTDGHTDRLTLHIIIYIICTYISCSGMKWGRGILGLKSGTLVDI